MTYEHMRSSFNMFIQLSRRLAEHDPKRRVCMIIEQQDNHTISVWIGDYTFNSTKLPYPYADNCIDYSLYNFSTQYNAYHSCFYVEGNGTKISYEAIVSQKDESISKYRVSRSDKLPAKCEKYA